MSSLPLAWPLAYKAAGLPRKSIGEKVEVIQQDGGAHGERSSGKRVRCCRAMASPGAFLGPQ